MDQNARTFAMLLSKWEVHYDPGWRQRLISEAEKWQDKISEAKEFLQKVCK